MRKEDKQEWMQELNDAPGLSRLAGQEPFEAPEGYFDNFSASVTDRINASKKETWVEQLMQWIREPIIAIPVLAIIITVVILFTRSGTIDNSQERIAMNYEDIYNAGLINELDETMICEFIDVAEKSPAISNEEDALLESISEESLINEL